MIKLNETQQKVRTFLIDMIRDPKYLDNTTIYQKVSNACDLGLDMVKDKDRKTIGELLCVISEFEHERGRKLLSAIVVLANTGLQGEGFFELADKLGVREKEITEHPMLTDDKKFSNAMVAQCHNYWNNDNYFNEFYEIPDSDKV